MKIRGSKTTAEEIDVSEKAILDAYLSILCEHTNFRRDYYVESGKVYYDEEVHTSHSWTDKVYVRDATESDINVAHHIKMTHDLWKDRR